MPQIRFKPLSTSKAQSWREGAPDDYDLPPELRHAAEDGYPCRHCLRFINKGERYLTLAYRPFPSLQPYAETGPILLHAEACPAYRCEGRLPPFLSSPDYILRGYGEDHRIVYGSGAVTPTDQIIERAERLLEQAEIAYLHVRSARNNCFHCEIERC